MQHANDNWHSTAWPRGMRRPVAAAYLGISPSHFDGQRRAGNIPDPKKMLGVELYDRNELDFLFIDSAIAGENKDEEIGYWDRALANGNQNT